LTRRYVSLCALVCSTLSYLLVSLALNGCGGTVNVSSTLAPTVTIAATPQSINAGGSVTLAVTAANATAVGVTGSDGSSYTYTASGGSKSITPSATTTYTATATGAGGKITAVTTVTVTPNPAPTVALSPSASMIVAGASATLTVTFANATLVTITGGTSPINVPTTSSPQTVTVSPATTTLYTATAMGATGTTPATATAQVTVTGPPPPAPTVTIGANPTSIAAGAASSLTVVATYSNSVSVSGSDGSSFLVAASGGTKAVSPSATTTYTATATGSGGTANASAIVTVLPAPTVNITASPNPIPAESSADLNVTASNATQVVVTGSDGSSYTSLSATGGSLNVTPSATTIYTATATGSGGIKSAATTLIVTPTITSFVANPTSVTAGTESSLSFAAVDATQVTIRGSDNTSYPQPGPSGGIQPVYPTSTTTYTLQAVNSGGSASKTVTVTVTAIPTPTVNLTASPATIVAGNPSTLTVTASNATQAKVSGNDGTSHTFTFTDAPSENQTWQVNPSVTTIYTATATGPGGPAQSSTATVTVNPQKGLASIDHVIFLMQENRSFDNYFGMLNPYRQGKTPANSQIWNVGDDGKTYNVDGIDDKLTTIVNQDDEKNSYHLFKFKSTCIDDQSSDWLASFGDVNRWDPSTTRKILMDGFVHDGEGYEKSCANSNSCAGSFAETNGKSTMGYYDQDFLNYYYYMASQFAISDRWFSPMATKSVDNRIATFTGGTTQGLVKDPGGDDHLSNQLNIPTIFQKLDQANPPVSWKIYFTVSESYCLQEDECNGNSNTAYPATYFSNLSYSFKFLQDMPTGGTCPTGLSPSINLGDNGNTFCYDPNHIAHWDSFLTDAKNGQLPSFAFIEAGYGTGGLDEHPGSGNDILAGQAQVAKLVNTFMTSPSWNDSVFFLSYDEAGGPYDHVPPVPGHSNDFTSTTDPTLLSIPDIGPIAVAPDGFPPCPAPGGIATQNCDLTGTEPGMSATDAAYSTNQGFGAQIGFRVPNIVISPFARRHYVSHIPMDHTAIIKFVENRFIGPNANLTARDAAQPDLTDFFDFNGVPWAVPPTPPTPVAPGSSCNAANVGP